MHLQQNELEIYIFAMFKFVFMQFFGRVEACESSSIRVWKGFRVIRELTEKQSVNRETSWKTAVIRELYIHCDV